MSEYKGVMVYGEVSEGKLSTMSAELLGCGRGLADNLKAELSIVIIGNNVSNIAQEAITSGADKVYVVEDPQLEDYRTDAYAAVMEKVAIEVNPEIILLGQTSIGRDLAPKVAFKLETGIVLDCVAIEIDSDSKQLLLTKPVYGGNAQAIFTIETEQKVATVRTKVISPLEPDSSRKGEVINVDAGLDTAAIRTSVLDKVIEEVEGIKLEDAEIIISGGRGIGAAEGFEQLTVLAAMLKGAVGASRAACDSGWMPETQQVGLTGKTVTPDFYLAIGISGASQHLAGCSSSKNIVAINKDPDANIFKVSRYGVVGDWKKVLPPFTEKVKELLSE
ncbi:electron transfer flavoprotein subunit alpha/FixB family protein [Chloroflexota bacterium]